MSAALDLPIRAGIRALSTIAAIAERRDDRRRRRAALDAARCSEICHELSAGGGAFMHDHRRAVHRTIASTNGAMQR